MRHHGPAVTARAMSAPAVVRLLSANSSLIAQLSALQSDSMFEEANLTSISTTLSPFLATPNSTGYDWVTVPSTNGSSSTLAPAGGFETLRVIKISLLAVIFVLILCGNVFVLLALNVSDSINSPTTNNAFAESPL